MYKEIIDWMMLYWYRCIWPLVWHTFIIRKKPEPTHLFRNTFIKGFCLKFSVPSFMVCFWSSITVRRQPHLFQRCHFCAASHPDGMKRSKYCWWITTIRDVQWHHRFGKWRWWNCREDSTAIVVHQFLPIPYCYAVFRILFRIRVYGRCL